MSPKIGRNDPCPCESGKKYKTCCLGKEQSNIIQFPQSDLVSDNVEEDRFSQFPDRRAMEGSMFGMFRDSTTGSLEQAQDIMYSAWDTENEKQRVLLAEKALEVSPDCADAYVLLAEETAESLDEAIEFYRRGVEAGEHALGVEAFVEDKGHFWGLLETRPYMRARLGLAQCLWEKGKRKDAVKHYEEMLELNPGDNQGIRYILALCYLKLKCHEELEDLLKEFEDDGSATWTYSTVLLSFRQEGDSQASRKKLKEAIESNPHVSKYLLGKKRLPRQLPMYVGFGDENEAISYAVDNKEVWKKTSGAVKWLGAQMK